MGFKPSDDGKVVEGKVVVYLRPRRGAEPPPDDAPAKAEKAGADKKEKPAPALAKAQITNLRWSVSAAKHGDEVEMLADVSEGKSLLFTVERRSTKGQWQALGSVKAAVEGGTARASMKLEHSGAIDLEHCRFRARLV
ncbi:MAG TPA: hypothetical protein VLW85_06060 [Myxococcales bacterium]|nr:hypothetical protein [Myxococcales bacterium]